MQLRIVAFIVLAAVAIAGSTILTNSQMQIRRLKPYVVDLDNKIIGLRLDLGLDPVEGDGEPGVVLSVPEELMATAVENADKELVPATAENDDEEEK